MFSGLSFHHPLADSRVWWVFNFDLGGRIMGLLFLAAVA